MYIREAILTPATDRRTGKCRSAGPYHRLYKSSLMKEFKITMSALAILFAACTTKEVSILETKSSEGKSEQSFIEGCIKSSLISGDTLLYYKFDLADDHAVFKETAGLNIGIICSRTFQDKSCSINLAFESISKNSKFDNLRIMNYGDRKIFTNFDSKTHDRRTDVEIAYVVDKYMAPVASKTLVNEEGMKFFLKLFASEISRALKNTDNLDYSCTAHLDGYFQDIAMTATIK